MQRSFQMWGVIALGTMGILGTPTLPLAASAATAPAVTLPTSTPTTIAQASSNWRTSLPRSLRHDILQDMARRTLLPVLHCASCG
ncbi:hypothetical protein [Trichothermofontia sp.]